MRIVEVSRRACVLDTGEELLIRYEKLQALCEQLQQEQADVTVRTWWTPNGVELIEVHRVERHDAKPSVTGVGDVVL